MTIRKELCEKEDCSPTLLPGDEVFIFEASDIHIFCLDECVKANPIQEGLTMENNIELNNDK
ncbi:hypothetical protein ACEK07_50290 [Alcanivoracaceae bacterium MT1]